MTVKRNLTVSIDIIREIAYLRFAYLTVNPTESTTLPSRSTMESV